MMQNITLSADKKLIEQARAKAEDKQTTLNAEFRLWLASYAGGSQSAEDLNALLAQFDYVKIGRKFTRDEMNER